MSVQDIDFEEKRQVRWNNKCPKCYSPVVWGMANSRPGAETSARCSRSIFGSVIVNKLDEIKICDWVGKAVRQKDGSVRVKNTNNEWLREIHFNNKDLS